MIKVAVIVEEDVITGDDSSRNQAVDGGPDCDAAPPKVPVALRGPQGQVR
jgi:hypothetical protein